ncbi:MAG: O-antigen ligase family protein [Terriglobia bacterium]|jgi:O-antigen ligase
MKFPQGLWGRIRNGIWEAGLLLVLPLAFYRGFAEQFSTPKLFLTKCLIITGVAVWALGGVWTPALRRGRFPLGWPLLAFSMMALISCLASPAPRFSLMEVEFALCGPAWVLMLASWAQGESAVRRIALWMGLAGGLVAGITLLQRFGFDPALLGGYQVDWGAMVERMRLYSTFGNPNFVGGYLIGTIFAALALVAVSKARWAKALWWGLTLIMLAAIAETGSRGAWVGLAVGLAAAAMIIVAKDDPRPRAVRLSIGSMRMFVSPSACWPMAILILTLAERVAAQLHGRVYLWRFSWPIFWRHPWVGSGWGAYQLLYLDLQGRFLAAHPEYVGYWTNNRLVHNDPLQLLLEAGLLGFAAFVWVLWKYAQEALEVRRRAVGAWARYSIAASMGGVTAILVDSVFNYQFAVPPTYILLFTLLAIPALLHDAKVERESEGPPSQALPAHRPPWRLALYVAGSVALLAAAGGLLWQQTRVLASERLYQTASDLEDHNDLMGAGGVYRRSINLNDLNGRAHFGLSRVLYSRDRSREALEEIVRAERTYTDSHQEVLRARILGQMGRDSEALAAYRHALWLDPTLTSVQKDIERLSKAR